MFIKPDKVSCPIRMAVARYDDIVANVVVVKSLECSVSIRLVTVLAVLEISMATRR